MSQQFIKAVAPIAIELFVTGRSSIFPSVRIGQALHETGGVLHAWNNVVGYKVGSGKTTPFWKGRSISTKTWEEYNGVRHDGITANWRAYDSISDCFQDQDLLFNLSRYKRVREASTPLEQVDAFYPCGYATDSKYGEKIHRWIKREGLDRYDKEANAVFEEIKKLQADVKEIKELLSQPVPPWAKEAVDKAVELKIVLEPDGGSKDFYRFVTIMNRLGLLTLEPRKPNIYIKGD